MIDQDRMVREPSPRAALAAREGIAKSFGGVRALRGVSLEVLPGEVHALLGENGAGKSTLIKILSGVHAYDDGSIEIDGQAGRVRLRRRKSRDAGIAVVYQDLSLVESLSVAANLMLGREPRNASGFLKKRQLHGGGRGLPQGARASRSIRAPRVGSLPFAYRQMTEICKALMGDVRTADPGRADLGADRRRGADPVRRDPHGHGPRRRRDLRDASAQRGVPHLAARHGVPRRRQRRHFRDGEDRYEATGRRDRRAEVMRLGDGACGERDTGEVATTGRCAVREAGAGTVARSRNDRLRGVDLRMRKGEIHGLAGLIGSGRTEILQTIFGLRPIELAANCRRRRVAAAMHPDAATAIRLGIALVPEDRHVQGLVLEHSIERNLTLPRLPTFRAGAGCRHAAGDARRARRACRNWR